MKKKKNFTLQDAEELLKRAKIRSNAIRKYVLRGLLEYGRPLSHGEIQEDEILKDFDRVTVYRTLAKLQEAGLLHVVEGTDGIRRYCAHDPRQPHCPGNHPHFVCQECGKMFCLTGQAMPHVEVEPGMVVKGKQYLVYGLCKECAKKNNY